MTFLPFLTLRPFYPPQAALVDLRLEGLRSLDRAGEIALADAWGHTLIVAEHNKIGLQLAHWHEEIIRIAEYDCRLGERVFDRRLALVLVLHRSVPFNLCHIRVARDDHKELPQLRRLLEVALVAGVEIVEGTEREGAHGKQCKDVRCVRL